MYRRKNIVITIMCIFVLVMALGYAAFSTVLNINGVASSDTVWNIRFTNITSGTAVGNATNVTSPSYTDRTATMDVKLRAPGDSMTYVLTLTNSGTMDAIIEDIGATATGSTAIDFSIEGIKIGQKLKSGATIDITIKIEYDTTVTDQPTELTKRLTVNIDAVQDIGQNITVTEPQIATKLSSKILSSNIAYATNASSPYVTASTGIDFSKPSSDTNGKGLYYMDDDTGTSYYFRGDVDNNYVKFGDDITYEVTEEVETYFVLAVERDEYGDPISDFIEGTNIFYSYDECYESDEYKSYESTSYSATCEYYGNEINTYTKNAPLLWRIVRINGDGSVRLIIDVNEDTYRILEQYYGFPAFNYSESYVKESVDDFYKDHLENNYGTYIVDTPYCADGDISGKLKCNGNTNKYTVDASKGNGLLDYPIGLITANEVILAGGIYDGFERTDYVHPSYLKYNGFDRHLYGTMTNGYYWYDDDPSVGLAYFGTNGGGIMDDFVYGEFGFTSEETLMRPVINLRSDVLVTGNGTKTDPYVVKMN